MCQFCSDRKYLKLIIFNMFFRYYRISVISSSNISVVLPEPPVSKTEDVDLAVNSESLTNSPQIVPPVVVRSVPISAIVDDVSNISLNSINSHPKVFIETEKLVYSIPNFNLIFLLGSGCCYTFKFYNKLYR